MMTKITAILSALLLSSSFIQPSVPPSAVTHTDTAAFAQHLGDINTDAAIDASDAAAILVEAALTGSGAAGSFDDAQKTAADINADDAINALDAAGILTYSSYVGTGGLLYLPEYMEQQALPVSADSVPVYSGEPYIVLNNNVPFFDIYDFDTSESFEFYSEPDSLGRCRTVYANIGQDLMPTEEREDISSIYPTGWHSVNYDEVPGGWLYNRCHLIGFQLTGENANPCNLITGTRYLNIEGMLDFENQVAGYIEETSNHVMYRVTPVFDGDDLVASGVLMEAVSVEDCGEGICFSVYCYNVQPEISIDYSSGESWVIGETTLPAETTTAPTETETSSGTASTTVSTTSTTPIVITTVTAASTTTSAAAATTVTTTTVTVPAIPSVVYYTKSGKKYHYENPCGSGTYYPCTLQEALHMGLEPCGKCVLN